MTSDGITADSLLTIYRELYHRFEVLRKPRNIRLLPSRSVTTLESSGPGWKLLMEHHLDQGRRAWKVSGDFRHRLPFCVATNTSLTDAPDHHAR